MQQLFHKRIRAAITRQQRIEAEYPDTVFSISFFCDAEKGR